MKRALILGGAGFIGSNLGMRLIHEGWQIRLFDINFSLDRFKGLADQYSLQLYRGDFFDSMDLTESLKGISRVYHFISTTVPSTSKENLEVEVETNLLGTVRLLETMRILGIKEIVYPSSGGTVYGNTESNLINEEEKTEPTCTYGLGKLLIEEIIRFYSRNYGLRYQILRISNPYGDNQKIHRRQGVIDAFLANVSSGNPLTVWGTGENVRDFIYIEDVIDAIVALDRDGRWNELYHIGTGRGASVRQIIEIIKEVTGIPLECTYTESEYAGVRRNVLNISKIKKHVGWTPKYEIAEGIREVWNRQYLCKTDTNK